MDINIYEIHPTKLEVGHSKLAPVSHRGRTRREREKQAKRATRIRARSAADYIGQKRTPK